MLFEEIRKKQMLRKTIDNMRTAKNITAAIWMYRYPR